MNATVSLAIDTQVLSRISTHLRLHGARRAAVQLSALGRAQRTSGMNHRPAANTPYSRPKAAIARGVRAFLRSR